MSATRSRRAPSAKVSTGRLSADAFPIVGIGASAGGLDACQKLLNAMPREGSGMAFILIQHLDPTHESMMADLLAPHTSMAVLQAVDGMAIEKDHLYVIPPGADLSISGGRINLSPPKARRGARFPFDHLLMSLAEECGENAFCVILSGTGTDGNLGLGAVRKNGGLVIAQTPEEADYDGMPRSAIETGNVNLVLNVAKIPEALIAGRRRLAETPEQDGTPASAEAQAILPAIVDVLRTQTPHDFRQYKHGTLQRRIERRMAMAAIGSGRMERYLDVLRDDKDEAAQLAKDLLIHVTSFFRDPKVFAFLAEHIIPELVRNHDHDHPLRLWVAGCSTGEETYSLAMMLHEEIAAQKRHVKLQLFASDVDSDAIAIARDGFYPDTIEADVSAERLERFFSREDRGYRIRSDIRAGIVFAVHDLLTDPPFSRIDMISCRNLLIYLRPEAQAKVIALFHFALRDGGILLLGSAETVGNAEGRFKIISRTEKAYRHIGRSRPGELGFPVNLPDLSRHPLRTPSQPVAREASLAGLCLRLLTDVYAPAAVLINRGLECLYSSGPTERYLRIPGGSPTYDLLAMARPEIRATLKSAIQSAWQDGRRTIVDAGQILDQGVAVSLRFDLHPLVSQNEELMLICFLNPPGPEVEQDRSAPPPEGSREAETERALAAARAELKNALRATETTAEEYRLLHEEALSLNEEYQSTNEELMTSKEELQSLNEELTALNAQLQETLEKQRTTTNDLQNVLYSTDVATLFLDTNLNIRFFTPATKSLFNVIPSDLGRPLADLNSLAADGALLADARTVLRTFAPLEREIEAQSGAWYTRRILPYRAQHDSVEGVVITFVDVTDRRHSAQALEAAKQRAEQANFAKSRFLAAASHDLRQPLQTLTLLQGFLVKSIRNGPAEKQVRQLGDALGTMTGILNTLLDINQIEAGMVQAKPVAFSVKDLLSRLCGEFAYQAETQGLSLHTVLSELVVVSDPRLLEQILRNLLANALKYTKKGGILIGCRRRPGRVSIEIWDTGIGIADEELLAIFDEYHQIDNPARQRSRGLGLGLSIVRRLASLLGHHITVHSRPGKGSVFAVEIEVPPEGTVPARGPPRAGAGEESLGSGQSRTILAVEDDPEVRGLIEGFLNDQGHSAVSAPDGPSALALVTRDAIRPDLLLVDFNLPNGMNGLELAARLRSTLHRQIPVIILTGDTSHATARDILARNCLPLIKPVKLAELTGALRQLLTVSAAAADIPAKPAIPASADSRQAVIFVIDDDANVRDGIRHFLEERGYLVEDFASCEDFLGANHQGQEACLLLDAYLPGMNGIELLLHLKETGHSVPTIMITGKSDVRIAVQAMKSGASDFLEKPFDHVELLACIERALEQSRDETKLADWHEDAATRIATLTPRQREIMGLILSGLPNKNIAADLGISQRTVEHHRALIMNKTAVKSLPALARLAVAAAQTNPDEDRNDLQ